MRRVVDYDEVVATYSRERQFLRTGKYLTDLMASLPRGAIVLDVGCGDGIPVDETLIKKGFLVTGVDVSKKMIEKARRNLPRGDFKVKDMRDLKWGEYEVDAIVSFYALFHVPRNEHKTIIKTLVSYLRPGGKLLITMGDKDFEGEHESFGVKMWASQYNPQKNREMVESCGIKVEMEAMDKSGGERHQILMGSKR